MLNVIKGFGVSAILALSFGHTQSFANSLNCVAGFTCNTKCPSAAAGTTLKDLNCRCKKDRVNNVCKPSGECAEYDAKDRPTGNRKACECERVDTMADIEVVEQL